MLSMRRKAVARARARPIQLVFHSQSLRRQVRDLGVGLDVEPGTKRRQTRRMMRAGATRETRKRVLVEIFSWRV